MGHQQDIGTSGPPGRAVPLSQERHVIQPRAVAASDTLTAGEVLEAGQQLECDSQEFLAVMRGDGCLVVHRHADRLQLWASGSSGHRDGFLAVRDNGDVSVRAVDGRMIWSAGTAGNPGAFVQLHDDGRLVVYSFFHDLLWSSAPLSPPPEGGALPSPEAFPNSVTPARSQPRRGA